MVQRIHAKGKSYLHIPEIIRLCEQKADMTNGKIYILLLELILERKVG